MFVSLGSGRAAVLLFHPNALRYVPMSPAAAVDSTTSEHRRYPTGVVAKHRIYIVAIGRPKLVLYGEVAGHLTDLRGEVTPIILPLFELFHSPVELEQFPGPL